MPPEPPSPSISVIVPTLNEAGRVGSLVDRLKSLGDWEIIVVDGGSGDGTAAEARAHGADRVLVVPPGRAQQQNAGAAAARGDVLFFLHADCLPEKGAGEAIRAALADPRCVAGCFRQRIDAGGIAYRLLERGNAIRVRVLKWAYGDQGIFVRREVFERIGRFPDLPLMEDLFLMKRLKRAGRIALIDARLTVSARRWLKRGVIRQTLRNWTLTLLAQGGVSPSRLVRFYPPVR